MIFWPRELRGMSKIFSRVSHCDMFYWKTVIQLHGFTMPGKNMNLPYSIRMYWTNFWQPTVHVQQNIFEKLLYKLVAHIFTLLLAPFSSKFVNYSRYSETLNFRKNSKSTSFSFENSDFTAFMHCSKTRCASNSWPTWTQTVPKEG